MPFNNHLSVINQICLLLTLLQKNGWLVKSQINKGYGSLDKHESVILKWKKNKWKSKVKVIEDKDLGSWILIV